MIFFFQLSVSCPGKEVVAVGGGSSCKDDREMVSGKFRFS